MTDVPCAQPERRAINVRLPVTLLDRLAKTADDRVLGRNRLIELLLVAALDRLDDNVGVTAHRAEGLLAAVDEALEQPPVVTEAGAWSTCRECGKYGGHMSDCPTTVVVTGYLEDPDV